MKLVRFSSDSGNADVTVVAELPGLIPNPLDAHMDLSSDGSLYLSPQDSTIYNINPGNGTILNSFTLPHDNDDIINGIAVAEGGVVYVVQDLNGPGTRLWAVDFTTQQATNFLSVAFDLDDIDFDNDGNLIGEDLNHSGDIFCIPLDGSSPQLVATMPVAEVPIFTFSSDDNAFYGKLTGALNNGRGLFRLPWANGQPAGALEYVKDIGNGQYVGLAAIPEPTTLALLAVGGLLVARRRLR
jgi:hypothetical protein